MIVRLRRLLPLASVALAGCFHLPARVCLTPPYDAPAGFSETYHAALARHEPILTPGAEPLPASVPSAFSIVLPYAATTSDGVPAEPPIDW